MLVVDGDRILTGTRLKGKHCGQICGPGGHVEAGETYDEAAVRETYEEFGIECMELKPLGILDGGRAYGKSAIFLCTDFRGTPRTDEEEMIDLKWRSIEELSEERLFHPFAQSLELIRGDKVRKYNHNHDPATGQFTGPGGSKTSAGASNGGTAEHKQRQMDIISASNPAEDDYHTWIRSTSDIKTYEETLQDSDWEGWEDGGFNPDYDGDMAKEALNSGKITVYSSYPIEQGIFVSPSRMEAESYSGDGTVYSKEVAIEDIAWIDPTQGQYANTSLQKSDRTETMTDNTQNFHIQKTDEDKRLVFGWANISITADGEVIEDLQHDLIDPEDLEEAVYEYVLTFRDTGEEHIPNMRKKGKMVESVIFTKEKMRAMGIPEGIVPEGWWIGFKIEDDDAWQKVKDGTYKMFSIEGSAIREKVEDNNGIVAKTFNQMVEEIQKFNPYHDERGRFTTKDGYASFSANTDTKAGQSAIDRESENHPAIAVAYDASKVESKIAYVRENASNQTKPLKEEPLNISKVMKEAGCSEAVAKQAGVEAKKAYDALAEIEPQMTADIVGAVSENGGTMFGLDFRLKQQTSLARKIASDAAEKNISLQESAADIKDGCRYTAIFEKDNFTDGYFKTKEKLESMGYKEIRCKNFYDKYAKGKSEQKAVQCVYENADGVRIELQFHTFESQGAKEVNHPLYERDRAADTTPEDRENLKMRMKLIGRNVPDPKGVETIKEHGR